MNPIDLHEKLGAALTFASAKHLALIAAVVRTRMNRGTVTPQSLRQILEEGLMSLSSRKR